MSEPKMHYAGSLRWTDARGTLHVIHHGFAACRTGLATELLVAAGRTTYEYGEVTCKACLRLMRKGDDA